MRKECKIFSENLKKYRYVNNLTQGAMAHLLKIKRSRYGAYEDGRAMAPFHILNHICEIFSLSSIDELLQKDSKIVKRVKKLDEVSEKYRRAPMEAKRIVDFILKIEPYETFASRRSSEN